MTTQEKREKLREVLNSAEIAEIREALIARDHELGRLKREGRILGIEGSELDAHLYVINGEVAAPGLMDLLWQEDWTDPVQVTAEFEAPDGGTGTGWDSTSTRCVSTEADPEFIPSLDQIEGAREWLKENGWPEKEDDWARDPDKPLWKAIRLIRKVGWTRAIEMAKETYGEAEKPDSGNEPDVATVPGLGDTVKIPSKGRGRNPVFRIHALNDGVVTLENARGKELRPVISLDGLKWDPEQTAWLLTYDMDAKEFLTVKEFNKLREERDLSPEEDLPKPAETAVVAPEVPSSDSQPSTEGGQRPAGLKVGDPLVVMDGEELSICLVGPIAMIPPHWLRVLDPKQPSGDPHLEGKELGRVQAGALEWDDDLDAWSVGKAVVTWTEEEAAVERA